MLTAFFLRHPPPSIVTTQHSQHSDCLKSLSIYWGTLAGLFFFYILFDLDVQNVSKRCVSWSMFIRSASEISISNSAFSVAGKGAMAEVSTIVSVVKQYLPKPDE